MQALSIVSSDTHPADNIRQIVHKKVKGIMVGNGDLFSNFIKFAAHPFQRVLL